MSQEEKNIKVLLVHVGAASFVKNDLRILEKYFNVETLEFPNSSMNVSKFIKRAIYTLLNGAFLISRSDAVVVWFTDAHAAWTIFLSKLLRKKTLVVVGGYDVACVPEIKYGMCTKNKIRQISRTFALNNSDMLLPVSYNTKKECSRYLLHATLCRPVYLGCQIPSLRNRKKKQPTLPLVITVGAVKWSNLKRKGIEIFVKTARLFKHSNVKFVVIGKIMDSSIDYLREISGNNVEFTDFVTNDELERYYKEASVYVQPSYHEGFGCSVAESMLYECVPVVSSKGALPEVVGDTGIIVNINDYKNVAEGIKQALSNPKLGKKAKIKVIRRFSLERREHILEKLIKLLVEGEIR